MRILKNLFYSLLIVFLISAIGYQINTLRVEAAQEAKGAGITTWSTDNGSGGVIDSDTTIASGAQVIYSVSVSPLLVTGKTWGANIHDAVTSGTANTTNMIAVLESEVDDTTTVTWSPPKGVLVTTGIWVDVTTARVIVSREEPAFRPIY